MAATASSVTRATDQTGDAIATSTKDDTTKAQNVVIDPEVMGEALTKDRTDGTAVVQDEAKVGPGRLFRAEVILIAAGAAGDRWLLVVDKATAATNGNLPILRSPKLSGDFASIDLGLYGDEFTTGCQLVLSTSPTNVQLAPAEGFFQWAVL